MGSENSRNEDFDGTLFKEQIARMEPEVWAYTLMQMDLITGFLYFTVLAGVVEALADGPKSTEQLATACNMNVSHTGTDILPGGEIAMYWKLHNKLTPIIGRPPYPGGDHLVDILSFIYRKSGLKFLVCRVGLSLYAYLETK